MSDPLFIMAAVVMTVLFLAVVAAIVYLGSLPGNIAKSRKHPQVDAINAASWIGLALGGIGWPFAFVWAFWSSRNGPGGEGAAESSSEELAELNRRIVSLESQLTSLRSGENK